MLYGSFQRWSDPFGGCLLRHKFTANDRSSELASQGVVQEAKRTDGNTFKPARHQWTALHEPHKTADRHLVQAAGHLPKPGGAIRLEVGAPAQKGSLRKHQVRPG